MASSNEDDVLALVERLKRDELLFQDVPESLKTNPSIIIAALQAGLNPTPSDLLPVQSSLSSDKQYICTILDVIATRDRKFKLMYDGTSFFGKIADHLQTDQDILFAMCKAGACSRRDIREDEDGDFDFLLHSREKLLATLKSLNRLISIEYTKPDEGYYLEDEDRESIADALVRKCDFLDDAEIIVEAYKACNEFDYLPPRESQLYSDRDFVDGLLTADSNRDPDLRYCDFFGYTTNQFQFSNPDLVAKAIELTARDFLTFDNYLRDAVWDHEQVIMACVKRRWPILLMIQSKTDGTSPYLSNRQIVSCAVTNDPGEFSRASPSLREDHDFILSLIDDVPAHHNAGDILSCASEEMKYKEEPLIAAAAKCSGAIGACFANKSGRIEPDDQEFLTDFASKIHSAVQDHHAFMEFVYGIATTTSSRSAPPVAKKQKTGLSCCCALSLLNDLDAETSTGLKKLIGIDFVGAPMGPRFHLLQAASNNLKRAGY